MQPFGLGALPATLLRRQDTESELALPVLPGKLVRLFEHLPAASPGTPTTPPRACGRSGETLPRLGARFNEQGGPMKSLECPVCHYVSDNQWDLAAHAGHAH